MLTQLGYICENGEKRLCAAGHYCPANPAAKADGGDIERFPGAFTEVTHT
jgi:hypothetical protein